MKKLKVSLVAALALSGLLSCSNARDATEEKTGERSSGPTITNRTVLRLGTELKLSEDQKTEVNTVYEAEAGQMQELHHAASLTPAQRRETYAAIREESAKKMKKVLTPEQHAKWQELHGYRGRLSPEASSNKKVETKNSE